MGAMQLVLQAGAQRSKRLPVLLLLLRRLPPHELPPQHLRVLSVHDQLCKRQNKLRPRIPTGLLQRSNNLNRRQPISPCSDSRQFPHSLRKDHHLKHLSVHYANKQLLRQYLGLHPDNSHSSRNLHRLLSQYHDLHLDSRHSRR